jgi:hypothetical protein
VNTLEKSSVTAAVASEQWRMPEPTDLIFPKWQRELFKTILDEQNLRFDRKPIIGISRQVAPSWLFS